MATTIPQSAAGIEDDTLDNAVGGAGPGNLTPVLTGAAQDTDKDAGENLYISSAGTEDWTTSGKKSGNIAISGKDIVVKGKG
jgi:hypothetical protein